MHYIGAVKRLFRDPILYFINALLFFVPGPNIAVAGYLVSLTGSSGPEASFGRFIIRFFEGFQIIAVGLMYAVLPLIALEFYSPLLAVALALLLFPPFVFSIAMLGNGEKLGSILELRRVLRAYSKFFITSIFKAGIFSLLVLLAHIMVPIAGWIGIVYGPAAVFLILIGEAYQDYFV